jgi:hypothetical protein
MLTNAEVEVNDPRQSEMRPDTPDLEDEDQFQARAEVQDPNAMSVDELNDRLLETARLASLEERAREIAAREERENDLGATIDEDEDAEPHTPTNRSRPASPPATEYNKEGRLTAHSKGKGRAN